MDLDDRCNCCISYLLNILISLLSTITHFLNQIFPQHQQNSNVLIMILQILSLHYFLLNLVLHIDVSLQQRHQSVVAIESRHIFSSIQFLQFSCWLQYTFLHHIFVFKQGFLSNFPIKIYLSSSTLG